MTEKKDLNNNLYVILAQKVNSQVKIRRADSAKLTFIYHN